MLFRRLFALLGCHYVMLYSLTKGRWVIRRAYRSDDGWIVRVHLDEWARLYENGIVADRCAGDERSKWFKVLGWPK